MTLFVAATTNCVLKAGQHLSEAHLSRILLLRSVDTLSDLQNTLIG